MIRASTFGTTQRAGFFFFNDTATTEIYTLSLHDALPISRILLAGDAERRQAQGLELLAIKRMDIPGEQLETRSEEHTSELQSHLNLVCRLLLEKKKKNAYRQ